MEKHGKTRFQSATEYLALLGERQRARMEAIRKIVKEAAPEAVEVMSYGMPAYKLHKRILIYFAAHAHHIGLYPASLTVFRVFASELQGLASSKGTIRFPNDTELPLALIRKIVQFRAAENLEKSTGKNKIT
jgi:uncharacterized protein YdhG (YjbR/CyaY superfamily)